MYRRIIMLVLFIIFAIFFVLGVYALFDLNESIKRSDDTIVDSSGVVQNSIFGKIKQVTIGYTDGSVQGVIYADVKTIKLMKIKDRYAKKEEYILKLEVVKLKK